MPQVTIVLDAVDESLLGALAAQNGRTMEEEVAAIVASWLDRRAQEDAEELLGAEASKQ